MVYTELIKLCNFHYNNFGDIYQQSINNYLLSQLIIIVLSFAKYVICLFCVFIGVVYPRDHRKIFLKNLYKLHINNKLLRITRRKH